MDPKTIKETSDFQKQDDQQTQKTKRNPRGPTFMPNVEKKKAKGDRVTVSLNQRGQIVGQHGTELQSYLGVLVRQTVPISIIDWHSISTELKDKIWEQAKVKILTLCII